MAIFPYIRTCLVWSSSYIYCMKKTRFFYEINYFLIVLLGWLLLFHKAAEVNRAREKEGWKTWTGCVLGIAGAGGIESGMAVGMQNTGSAEATENDDLPEIAESGDERLSTLSGKSVCFSWIQAINLIIIPL